MKANYMLKVEDARAVDIQKALQAAGIKVRSIQEIHKEGEAQPAVPGTSGTGAAGAHQPQEKK
ncbi:MAG: hypothetical protein M0018_03270 [Nitrospiraceae bacterium]|nr:hypothetical protein [Nitrospiraceae bacterium]